MKKILFGFLAVCLLIGGIIIGRASGTIILGPLFSILGTTNVVTAPIGSVRVPMGTFLIQNAGLTATQDLAINVQLGLDTNNFVTVATYTPSVTNPATDLFDPRLGAQTVYMRIQVATTNYLILNGTNTPVQVGGTFQN